MIDSIDHVVLIVRDIERTEKFYSVFLDSQINKSQEQVVYQIAGTKIFFSLPHAEYNPYNKDAGGLNHLAFHVSSLEELVQLETRLNQNDIKNSGIQIDKYGGKEFIWFDDPDGYRLELYLR